MRPLTGLGLVALLSVAVFGQSNDTGPKFEIADVRVSPKAPNQFARTSPPRGGRYEVKTATMIDLIRTAWGFDNDKILGGPSWLEMDRFDVIAKAPADVTPDNLKLMLQTLLADRFELKTHKESRPLPTYALTVGKKPQLKEADGSGDTGCKPQTVSANAPPVEGGLRLFTSGPTGASQAIQLGPGMVIQFNCRNMTMEAFAAGLRGMLGTSLGPNPVLDQTGLKGMWNFDVKWSMQLNGGPVGAAPGDRISIFDAVEKQLGLKLEEQKVATPVIVVDSVRQVPTDNPPGVAEALPPIPVPTEFEVADVKPSDPDARGGSFRTQNGRLMSQGMPLQFLLSRAFNTNGPDQIVGAPKWVDTERFDITAKVPASAGTALDLNTMGPMIRNLLEDRFKMKVHTEERQLPAYSLVAAKPKMKKADPTSRTHCLRSNPPPGAPPGAVLTCQNITMAQFAEQLRGMAQGLNWGVLDATNLEGNWDFVLTWSPNAGMSMGVGGGRGGEGGAAGPEAPAASDPSGGFTLFEAIEKQLGLKLEMQKRSLPVYVIDHLEQKPTDN